MSKSPEYRVWQGMRERCGNPRHRDFHNYGGRGISVCERWRDFGNFFADMGARPGGQHQIDRINNDLGYQPGNCRWATPKEQSRNKRCNIRVALNGCEMIAADLLPIAEVKAVAVYNRLRRGLSPEEAIKRKIERRHHGAYSCMMERDDA